MAMQVPLQITMHQMERSPALDLRIRDSAAKLERLYPRITRCRVAVEQVELHQQQGRHFGVRVEVRAPGHKDVVSSLQHHEDVYVALRDAFDAVRRKLRAVATEPRG